MYRTFNATRSYNKDMELVTRNVFTLSLAASVNRTESESLSEA